MADAKFAAEFLQAHNDYRKQHGAPPLTLDAALSRSAQAWATILLKTNVLKSSNTNAGENLFKENSPKTISGRAAVDSWYNEIKKYDFKKPGLSPATEYFTRVVWKDCKQVGVGMASASGVTYVVGHYSPAGNVSGSFEKNVLPLK